MHDHTPSKFQLAVYEVWQPAMSSSFEVEAMVRGYHIYNDIWDASLGEHLQCGRETGNPQDIYAVAVLKSGVVVGHVPRKISSICSVFLRRGGVIHCIVTAARRYSADLEQGGLEIPCILRFEGCTKYSIKAEKLIRSALSTEQSAPSKQSDATKENSEPPTSPTEQSAPSQQSEENEQGSDAKKRKLTDTPGEEDLVSGIMRGEMLSDLHVNFSQRLLKRQFPNLRGLQSTLYQQKSETEMSATVKDQLQIIHCHSNHWIAVSSVGCMNGDVNVYDSIYSSLDENTKRMVCNLFHTNTKNIKVQSMQKQVGGLDCGVFAIAVITSIAYDKDPSELRFDQKEMRRHLSNCFNDAHIKPFPCY